MRYSVPVNAPDEVAALAAAGADELYCGYLDAWWAERYGDHDSASRRQGRANLSTPEELESTVREARRYGLPIHLALNARYTEPQLDHLVELYERFGDWGGTGVILSDLGLLWRLSNNRRVRDRDLTITLSLLAVAQNTATLRAYQRLGVTRVVFPRFVSWLEAGSLLMGVPGMEASFMAFFDKCPLVDGYCRHRHGVSYLDRESAQNDDAPPLYTFDTTYRTHACLGSSCTYLEPYPCAACHMRRFERAGVGTAKIGGRGRPLEERLRALRFLRVAEAMESDEERRLSYQQTFDRSCACYYGKTTQSRYAIEPVVVRASGEQRVCVGSETDIDEFQRALVSLCRGEVPQTTDSAEDDVALTLLVPPLANGTLHAFVTMVPMLIGHVPFGTHVAVNDLGTLGELTRALATYARNAHAPYPLRLTLGTLLARLDDSREVEHFLSADQNPARPVWGPRGEPRMLTYAPPTDELVRHWRTPSLAEPSAQEALDWLFCGGTRIPYEFA